MVVFGEHLDEMQLRSTVLSIVSSTGGALLSASLLPADATVVPTVASAAHCGSRNGAS